MKWFVYRTETVEPSRLFYVNARTEKAALKRLSKFMTRFKYEGEPKRQGDEPQETLVHCWHHYGVIAHVVYKDD